MKVQNLETTYRGQKFRSRLEARFAIFFDALNCEWQYEPEGFQLPSGNYLPDFYLPKVEGGTWIEVKPYGKNTLKNMTKGLKSLVILRAPIKIYFSLRMESPLKIIFIIAHTIPKEVLNLLTILSDGAFAVVARL
jgi:hypothetical protein